MKIMDIPWGSDESKKFATNVGLITSNGPHGHNVMAAEWTHHVSYSPGMIMVNVGFDKATEANIMKTKEFGVSLGMPYARHLEKQLWELRVRHGKNRYRIIYFLYTEHTFVLLHGLTKKTGPVPRADIKTAESRLDDYLSKGR